MLFIYLMVLSATIFGQTSDVIAKNEDAIILYDSNNIIISGKKAGFIYFLVERSVKVKIMNVKGKETYSNFVLPEPFDASYIYHNSEVRNPNNCYSRMKVNRVSGRIVKPDGTQVEADIKQTINKVTSVGLDNFFVYYDQFKLSISNLDSGDILVMHYSYQMPYSDNFEKLTSMRFFFNGADYKDEYYMHLASDDDLNLVVKYFNKADPDTVITAEQISNYYWHSTKLGGSMDEAGAHAYTELPYIIVTLKPSALIYELPYSFEKRYIPLYALAATYKEKAILGILQATLQGVKNKSYIAVDKFIDEHTRDITDDSLGYVKLVKIHNVIVNDFTYDNDTTYFKKDDPRMERIGEYIGGSTLRDISRYTAYAALISRIGLGFYTAYVVDTRVGVISDDFVSPMFDNDFLIAVVLKNNTLQLVYPKKSNFGYYVDEVPFYFENTIARLVNVDDYQNYKTPINENFRKMNTPSSSFNDNDRKSSILTTVDLDKCTATFNAKIVLRGQYSTLMRGTYMNGYKDKSVNELYASKINEIGNGAKLQQKEVNVLQQVFPFKTEVKVTYSSDSAVKKIGNNTYRLNTLNWFQHIITNQLHANARKLNFYPDFKGKDTYSYNITFTKNIEIIKPIENITIDNDFGNLIISISHNQPNTLMITSYFLTKTDKVPPDNIKQVEAIYNKIKELNQATIDFKVVD